MSPPRSNALDYINFLLATPDVASATEAARVHPAKPTAPAHDAFTQLLHRLEPDPETLWQEARPQVRLAEGALVLDDTVLDKPHARHIDLVGRHFSGKHRSSFRASTWSRSSGPTATASSPATTASTTTPGRPPRTTTSAP